MESREGEVRSQAKRRLVDLLKAAVGGVVIAAAALTTPTAEADSTHPTPPQAALHDRVQELRQHHQTVGHLDVAAEESAAGGRHDHWGNHWNNWNNWHNWHNWHNW